MNHLVNLNFVEEDVSLFESDDRVARVKKDSLFALYEIKVMSSRCDIIIIK